MAARAEGGPLQGGLEGAAALAEIDVQAARLPAPVRQWITGISKTSSAMSADGLREQLTDAWLGSGGEFCFQAVRPLSFDKKGASEISLEDFSRLFAKGGLIDTFFEQNLASFVENPANPGGGARLVRSI